MEDIKLKKRSFFKWSVHNYLPIATKLIFLVTHASKVLTITFQGRPSNPSGDKAENVLCSPSKAPLNIARLQPNLHRL